MLRKYILDYSFLKVHIYANWQIEWEIVQNTIRINTGKYIFIVLHSLKRWQDTCIKFGRKKSRNCTTLFIGSEVKALYCNTVFAWTEFPNMTVQHATEQEVKGITLHKEGHHVGPKKKCHCKDTQQAKQVE